MVVCILQRLAPADDDEAPRADVQELGVTTLSGAAVIGGPFLCPLVMSQNLISLPPDGKLLSHRRMFQTRI